MGARSLHIVLLALVASGECLHFAPSRSVALPSRTSHSSRGVALRRFARDATARARSLVIMRDMEPPPDDRFVAYFALVAIGGYCGIIAYAFIQYKLEGAI